ncbi:chloride channel protein [Flavobacterium psychrophilum]|uniref:chloride channel protein n=1 Tax=Flavobacterium psychrophilum TaxID=96345 RepID=UPI000B7C342C|nr:chloride channel protein [Flavobacterium psychrophilum]EKT4500725.1 chloride channel protein [Flavobacterium psychrophilum]EKT4509254.1 chloride channel protein [Flavobacterium psychrophilum]EKT4551430.1 chloride channel protein [Flavobacterium psychrophilum]ELM3644832.1 chloride channel protein [Flavobacterium psychrophilum]ELV7524756.1 chloride channel protein [Flavobacterium psychrophilum]
MPSRILVSFQLFVRKIIRRFESIFFLAKEVLSERNFIYLSSVVIAISCSFAVIILKSFAHNVFLFANYLNTFLKLPYSNSILPVIGILLTVFVIRRFLDGKLEKGSSHILQAVAKKGGVVPKKQMYAQIITSSLTVGLGGSAGLESPIVITGAAFGSNFAQKYKLSQKDRILLLACGVAAGIGSAFNAPIAGVLFAIEVVLTDVSISAFIPIMISAATGALVSQMVLSRDILLSFKQEETFNFHNTPYYILLGVLAGFVSVYHARNFRKVEHFFSRFKSSPYKKALFGAILLAVLIFFFPTLFGEGYESIRTLSTNHPEVLLDNTILKNHKNNQWILLAFIGITVFLKSFATGITLGSGGNGGNFAPSLFVGSYLGFFVAKSINLLGISSALPVGNFAIVGMAGILSGLFHAPLTAIFLIGEITGGYDLMVPLMIVSSISFAVSKRFEKHSMDVKSLADKGEVFTSNKDKNILQSIDFLALIKTNIKTITIENSLENLVEHLSTLHQEIFPVIDEKEKLVGIVDFNDIRTTIFNPFRIKHTCIKEILKQPIGVIQYDDGIEIVMEKFQITNQTTLPVIKYGKFFGFISKIDILEEYREKLKEMIIE